MLAIYKREVKSYFINMTGFVFITLLLLLMGIFTTAYNLLLTYASMTYAIGSMEVVFLLTVPILTMKVIADDRRLGTDRLLYSLPIKIHKIVLAKYLAMLTVFIIPVTVIAAYPLLLGLFGTVPLYPSYAALVGFFFLGASLIALCTFLSALTESQVIAAILGFGVTLGIYLLPTLVTMIPTDALASFLAFVLLEVALAAVLWLLTHHLQITLLSAILPFLPTVIVFLVRSELFENLFPTLIARLALFTRFEQLVSGIFDLTAIVYFVSVIVFFLFLTAGVMEKKRQG